jgi:hypothetical protein
MRRRIRAAAPAMLAAALAAVLLAACQETEPEPPRATLSASRAVEAGLVASTLSPGAGDTIVVLARVTAGPDVRAVASFTARLSYDPARLSFVGEVARADEAMRVINAEIPGDLRVSGIASRGIQSGDLVGLRFVANGSGGAGTLQLAVDQLHATDGEDLARVVVRPPVVNAQVAR